MNGDSTRTVMPDRVDAFLEELTELSARHGIAIGGNATLYLMERPDYDYGYKLDGQSNLTRE